MATRWIYSHNLECSHILLANGTQGIYRSHGGDSQNQHPHKCMFGNWARVRGLLFKIEVGAKALLPSEFFPADFLLRKEMHLILVLLSCFWQFIVSFSVLRLWFCKWSSGPISISAENFFQCINQNARKTMGYAWNNKSLDYLIRLARLHKMKLCHFF